MAKVSRVDSRVNVLLEGSSHSEVLLLDRTAVLVGAESLRTDDLQLCRISGQSIMHRGRRASFSSGFSQS